MTTLTKTEARNPSQETPATQATTGAGNRIRFARPEYDVRDRNESFEVRVVMPGVNKSGVEISYEGDTLTILGTRAHSIPEAWRPLRREIRPDSYRLELQLNVDVDGEHITAQVEDGVLLLKLPKAEAIKPRKIPVE